MSTSNLNSQSGLNLRRRPRRMESFIRFLLFLAGAISILTTIGIVYELGKESLHFFTSTLWQDTNKQIVADIRPMDTTILVSTGGSELSTDTILKIGGEAMRITAIDGQIITVERGQKNTKPQEHKAGAEIYTGERVKLLEFFTSTTWEPQIGHYVILPLLNAS